MRIIVEDKKAAEDDDFSLLPEDIYIYLWSSRIGGSTLMPSL